MNIDFTRGRLMTAMATVAVGKNLNDFVVVLGGRRGETILLLHAFNGAVTYLGDKYFDPNGLALARCMH
jgi:hypothetical protein